MLLVTITAFLAINLLTIIRFHLDKTYAIEGRRRVPERDLLTLALVGGSPGALLARQLFKHKTRKEPFSTQLWVIVFLQVMTIGAVGGFLIAG